MNIENIRASWLYKVFLGLVVVSFLTPLIYSSMFSEFTVSKTLFFYLIVELALPFYLYLAGRFYGFRHLKNPVVIWSAVFLGIGFISALVGVNFITSFWGNFERMGGIYFSVHMFLWFLYLIFIFRLDHRKFNFLTNIVIFLGVLTSIQGILEQVGLPKISDQFAGRSMSMFGNPVFFAAFLVVPLFLCFYQMDKDREKKYWYIAAIIVILLGILSTKTAGAMLGLIAGAVITVIFYFSGRLRTKNGRLILASIAILGLIGIIGVFKIPVLKEKFASPDADDRLVEWEVALHGFSYRPILGVGPENFSYLANKYFDAGLSPYNNGFFDKPHNYFLEVLTTTGLIGFVIYLTMLSFVVRGLIKLYRNHQISKLGCSALIGGLSAYLVQNFFAFDTISALMVLTFLYSYSSLGFEPAKEIVPTEKGDRVLFVAASVLVLMLLGINFQIARTNLYLAKAMRASQSDPQLAQTYFEQLTESPSFIDQGRIGDEYGNFVISAPTDLSRRWIPKAISYNQIITAKNPNYYYRNQLDLAGLYLVKSQLEGKVDEKLFEICSGVDQFAPNRVECDLNVMTAYAFENKPEEVERVLNHVRSIAPNNRYIPWQEIYADALLGRARPVLDKTKALISKDLDYVAIAQLDKIAGFYMSNYNYNQVIALYNDASRIYPWSGYLVFQLARTYALAGDKVNAGHLVDKLKELDPKTYVEHAGEIDNFLKPSVLQVR